MPDNTVPVSVLVAAKNEETNLRRCLTSLQRASHVCVIDSQSIDRTGEIALESGAELVQFVYQGGYPKKRQWALATLDIRSPWVLLLDADEVVSEPLWDEIARTVASADPYEGYLVKKQFYFLGRPLLFGGFSHRALLLFKRGRAQFEHLINEPAGGMDMEVHERMLVDGRTGRLRFPLLHQDCKGLAAYIERHNQYSTWEATVRMAQISGRHVSALQLRPKMTGCTQERRRWLKNIAMRVPGEPALWFAYHYLLRCGFLDGYRGYTASRIRANYIADVRAKMFEMQLQGQTMSPAMTPKG